MLLKLVANPSGSPSVAVREERRGGQNGSGWADRLIDKPVLRSEGEGKKEKEKRIRDYQDQEPRVIIGRDKSW